MNNQKTLPTDKDVLNYIDTMPTDRKKEDAIVALELMKKITGLAPRMWGPSIIGFGEYSYTYESGHSGTAAQIAFSPRKQRMVFYVMGDWKGKEALLEKLGKHKLGKICLYINKLADVDMDVLETIIAKAWKHVLAGNNLC